MNAIADRHLRLQRADSFTRLPALPCRGGSCAVFGWMVDPHQSLCAAVAALFLVMTLTSAVAAEAAKTTPKKRSGTPIPTVKTNNLAPLAAGVKAISSHSPFEAGDCSLCHQNKDPKNPGPVTVPGNESCLECHEDFKAVMGRKFSHVAAKENCGSCHNPHNSAQPKLLVEELGALCNSCHADMKTMTTEAKVKHDAVTTGQKCSNCHDAHGAKVEHLLTKLPFDLCINCHGKDGVLDHDGKKLTNFKTLLAENPEHHGPVADKDCSACHNPHGGEHFRLLNSEYPQQFYSAYDPKLYALCFECHEEQILKDPTTKNLTLFRNGEINLHYLHVNKAERGRTCRACHEVHAAKQTHQMRDGVPYGAKGWTLKINYTKTPFGGTCDKTCHETKSYTNKVFTAIGKPANQK